MQRRKVLHPVFYYPVFQYLLKKLMLCVSYCLFAKKPLPCRHYGDKPSVIKMYFLMLVGSYYH